MTGSSGSVAAVAFLALAMMAGAAQTTGALQGHWECRDITTSGSADYYEFDFGANGELAMGSKTSDGIYTGRGTWTGDPAETALVHLSSHGKVCNPNGFGCREMDLTVDLRYAMSLNGTVAFRSNGTEVRCRAADGQIDVDNWGPANAQKLGAILGLFGQAIAAANNADRQDEPGDDQMGDEPQTREAPARDRRFAGNDGAEAYPENAEPARNQPADNHNADLAKKKRINFLRWFIADHERTLADWKRQLADKEAQNDHWAREGKTTFMTSPLVLAGDRRNIDRLEQAINKAKRELAQLEH